LIVGCGKSSFSSELYDDGFEHLVNLDSLDIIEEMLERNHQSRQKMRWMEWGGCELPFNDSSFDVVIDRGSMEALIANEGSAWDPDEIIISAVDRLSREFSRVLTTGGIFLQVSFSQPHFRTKYFMGQHVDQTNTNPYAMTQGYCQSYNWTLSVTKLQLQVGLMNLFLYSMRKS
jgi:EEF1A lysine methyltransferase 4